MNKINRNNYESYFLDFLEGNITPEDSEQLKFFLEANEDLKEELYSFESIAIKNTLGVCRYRRGDITGAVEALQDSLGNLQHPTTLAFLAM